MDHLGGYKEIYKMGINGKNGREIVKMGTWEIFQRKKVIL